MKHVEAVTWNAVIIGAGWVLVCVAAAGGLHLFRRVSIMLDSRHGWADSGTLLGVRRRHALGKWWPPTGSLPKAMPVRPVMAAEPLSPLPVPAFPEMTAPLALPVCVCRCTLAAHAHRGFSLCVNAALCGCSGWAGRDGH